MLKGLGGEIIRISLSKIIIGISLCQFYLSEKSVERYFEFIFEALRTTIDDI